MIYTVGLIAKYEAAIDNGSAIKLGPHGTPDGRTYPGGWVGGRRRRRALTWRPAARSTRAACTACWPTGTPTPARWPASRRAA